jgi:glucose/arabinose dehydrogenase
MRRLVPVSLTVLALCGTAAAAVQLVPVVSSLSYPTFVANAHDGSGRLFLVEKAGRVKVLAPGSSTPTVFLDIHSEVVDGAPPSEQGLLSMAFHPQFPANPRFYVAYTRVADGALQVSEFQVSADPNVASTTEKPLLAVPHPTYTNHNGGMLAFGPDGYLYIGTGDGGGANDPFDNGQNVNVLNGKLLRIDVDHGSPYAIPADNPFAGATPGADEIFAYGFRNPWRFSFDRETGQLWVGDVGQSQREEVDTPILKGGNYGWVVMEGTLCDDPYHTGTCGDPKYTPPILEYDHSTNGRCAITGGYVYRGTAAALPQGTYAYGDYCSGEIFTWNGSTSSVLLDTTAALDSFGEDEAGEIDVVDIAGSVTRLGNGCTYTISPTHAWVVGAGDSGNVTVTAAGGCAWLAKSLGPNASVTSGASGTGGGTVGWSIGAASGAGRTATLSIAGNLFTIRQVTLTDVFALINWLFAGGPAPAGPRDINGDGKSDVADVFYAISWLFAGGPPPP